MLGFLRNRKNANESKPLSPYGTPIDDLYGYFRENGWLEPFEGGGRKKRRRREVSAPVSSDRKTDEYLGDYFTR